MTSAKDIIPAFLRDNKVLTAYRFKGYWKDVGTIDSLWEANMDLLNPDNELDLGDSQWKDLHRGRTDAAAVYRRGSGR